LSRPANSAIGLVILSALAGNTPNRAIAAATVIERHEGRKEEKFMRETDRA
jgi:hypothetical protein